MPCTAAWSVCDHVVTSGGPIRGQHPLRVQRSGDSEQTALTRLSTPAQVVYPSGGED